MGSPGMIRDISQSVQNRSIAKQAPDIICYIDGANYLINPYLQAGGLAVPFNDYVNAWSSSYDIDAMVPSGSLTIQVPVQAMSLFELPGGNKILKSMAEIRVFCKGYYFSAEGNTVYHQIFKGYITAVNSTFDGMHMTYTLPCRGALGILERMQVDQTPGSMSSSPMTVTPFVSNQSNLDPYGMIAWIFVYSSMIDGFTLVANQQARLDNGNPYRAAIEERFVAKWQALLYDLARDVHIFGAPNVKDIISSIAENIQKPDSSNTPWDKDALGIWTNLVGKLSESTVVANQEPFYEQLKNYHPDFKLGTIQLFNAQTTTRLERLRYIVSLIGFEAYQDVDGGIVIKPPLYNLDVVNLLNDGSESNADLIALSTPLGVPAPAAVPADPPPDQSVNWITDTKNPFVVKAEEIAPGENESEDEAGVRLTRITAFGNLDPSFQVGGSVSMRTIAEDVDVAKLAQYGLRTEPPKEAPMFRDGDDKAVFAYAASELAKANKGYRTFTCQIPIRPELKLGFPIYFPHKDMYGYIKTLTMQWTRGGDATTSIVCDSLRFRPLFPEDQQAPVPNQPGQQQNTRFLTQSPNLVMQWTKAATDNPTSAGSAGLNRIDQLLKQSTSNTAPSAIAGQSPAAASSSVSTPSPAQSTSKGQGNANPSGKISTLPFPQELIVKQQIQMLESLKAGTLMYTPNNDTGTHNWRIQPDVTNAFDGPRPLDSAYYETLRTVRPYTDHKGYELIGPFPWGRWKSLKDSLSTFTVLNPVFNSSQTPPGGLQPVNPAADNLSNANAFMFTGDSVAASTESATELLNNLNSQRVAINSFKVFELSYTGDPTNIPGPEANLGASAPAQPSANTADAQNAAAASVFMTGLPNNENVFTAILNTIPIDDNENLGLF